MKTGIDLVADERKRQIEAEGWTPEHDDAHEKCELSNAASCYIANAQAVMMGGTPHPEVMSLWPWDFKWWKPSKNPVRDLVKGLALGVAELDRVLRGLPAIERLMLEEEDRRPLLPQEVERGEDMGGGRLALFRQEDGDIIVTVYGEKVKGFVERQAVEFCSVGSGGGASPRTMEALRELMRAMDEDNKAPAGFGGRAEHVNRAAPVNHEPGLGFAALRRANVDRQEEWCPDQKPDLSFRGNELAGETGEACNVIKKLERERHGWRGTTTTVDDLAEELADVIITADLVANQCGIDLGKAVVAKFNDTSVKQGISIRLVP